MTLEARLSLYCADCDSDSALYCSYQWAIYTSMTVRTLQRVTKFVWFDNYITLYQDDFYWQAVRNTIVFTTGSIITKFIFAFARRLLHATALS